MSMPSPFRCFETIPEIIRPAVMLYVRFPLSLRYVEDPCTSAESLRGQIDRFDEPS